MPIHLKSIKNQKVYFTTIKSLDSLSLPYNILFHKDFNIYNQYLSLSVAICSPLNQICAVGNKKKQETKKLIFKVKTRRVSQCSVFLHTLTLLLLIITNKEELSQLRSPISVLGIALLLFSGVNTLTLFFTL